MEALNVEAGNGVGEWGKQCRELLVFVVLVCAWVYFCCCWV